MDSSLTSTGASSPEARFRRAIAEFDRVNAQDPHRVGFEGGMHPFELLHARRMTEWVERLKPGAPEHVKLAARCQHIRRWEIARDTFPAGRAGYLQWRTKLYAFHAGIAGEMLRECGYDDAMIQRVQTIVRKQGMRGDADMQLIEDALCLTFLELQLDDMLEKIEPEKMGDILEKTWAKMSPAGRAAARRLDLPPAIKSAIARFP